MSSIDRPSRCIGLLLAAAPLVPGLAWAQPFDVAAPGLDPADLRVTTFATGLNYPVGMAELDDGSILVATSNGTLFGSGTGSLIRLADTDNDGVADVQQTLVSNVPGGGLTSLRRQGEFFFTTGQGSGRPISIYRAGATPADPLSLVGSVQLNYPSGGWLHPHSALATRPTPGTPGGVDLFFQLGSDSNFATTTRTVSLTTTGLNATLAGDAIHVLRFTPDGSGGLDVQSVTQVATGVRNAAGIAFHPVTGDLYFEDNGIDGLVSPIEPESADELNRIAATDIGGAIEDFGFPQNYTQYRTGTIIGGAGIQPLVAFQPLGDPNTGAEAEGPNDIAFAPELFPEALRGGVFVGMHGQFSLGGLSNEENPLVFVDLDDFSYTHFVGNDEPGIGHLDGLLATRDALFAADISSQGGFGGASLGSGVIYQIKSLVSPLPADLDLDGDVDDADFALFFAAFSGPGVPTGNAAADLDGDGDVDDADYALAFAAFTGPTAAANLPEPHSLALLALGLSFIACRCRPNPAPRASRRCGPR